MMRRHWSKQALSLFAITLSAGLAVPCSRPAHALERLYIEFGPGMSMMINPGTFFGNAGMGAFPGVGLAATINFGWVMMPREKAMALHLAAQWHYSSISETATGLSAAFHALHPVLRLEAKQKFFFSFGASPLVLSRYAAGLFGFDSLTVRAGAISMLADMGYNHRLSPAVSIQFLVVAQMMYANGGFSPLPAIDTLCSFRFFIDAAKDFSVEESRIKKRKKHDGWRYPYGNEKY